jgi:hypothetical protein
MPIPIFNASGVLPPYTGESPADRASNSPYEVTMLEFATHFSTTPERTVLLQKLIAFRQELKAIGITAGFQLVDGSFVEDSENNFRQKSPADIDLVTFAFLPVGPHDIDQFVNRNIRLFVPTHTKEDFSCDAYFVDLNKDPRLVVEDTMYWYGLFSHQRATNLWKGMIQIPLMSNDQEWSAPNVATA